MKFKIHRDSLSRFLSISSKAIGNAHSLPILQNLLIKASGGAVEITGSNLDMSITSSVKAEVESEGATTVNARKFLDIASRMPAGQLTIESDAKFGISIKSGKSAYRVNGIDSAEFPASKEPGKTQSFSIEQSKLKALLASCEFAVCKDNSRHAMLGFLIEASDASLLVAAADGRRLAKSSVEAKLQKARFTIPLKPASDIASLCEGDKPVEVKFSEDKVWVTAEHFSITSKLIDAPFPDINAIIPKSYANKITVNKGEIIEAARRAGLVTSEKSSGLKLFFGKKSINITAQSAEFGDAAEEVDCKLEGSPIEINVSPKYLTEALEASTCEKVIINTNDSRSPFSVSDENDYLCVIAPLLPK